MVRKGERGKGMGHWFLFAQNSLLRIVPHPNAFLSPFLSKRETERQRERQRETERDRERQRETEIRNISGYSLLTLLES